MKYLILTKYETPAQLEPSTKVEISLGPTAWYLVDKAASELANVLGFYKVHDTMYMLGGYWASDDGMTILEAVSRHTERKEA